MFNTPENNCRCMHLETKIRKQWKVKRISDANRKQ
jgi:hypothetical protein